jgi:hypothetical protein
MAASLLNRHSPHEIAEAVEVLVDVLDLMGGDPDVEANGDELDGNRSEDDFMRHEPGGPGCPIADPPEDEGDREQAAWLERLDQTAQPFPDRVWASYRNGEDAELTWVERHSPHGFANTVLPYTNDDDEDGHDDEPEEGC